MNFTLKSEHQQFIQAELSAGHYANSDEIIDAALQLLSKQKQYSQWLEEIQIKIDLAAEQLDRGQGIDGSTAIEQLRERLHQTRDA